MNQTLVSQPSSRTNPRRLELGTYPFSVPLLARFGDMDIGQHLNNVAIARYYEEARVVFNQSLLGDLRLSSRPDAPARVLVAQVNITYLREGRYPGQLTVGVGVARIGTTSYTLGCALFQEDDCLGVSDAVIVHAGKDGPAPLPEPMRERLNARLIAAEAR
ncbi:MAG: acyl-CoA thioesterase [Alphaproteobacteria bacterium]|nr:acyl-CoA thioesterase [Alphaproteobacteria bacterium]